MIRDLLNAVNLYFLQTIITTWLEGELVCRNVINTTLAYGPKTCTVRDVGNRGLFV
jgi:hypothetical protein